MKTTKEDDVLEGGVITLNRMVREGLFERVTFELILNDKGQETKI